MIRDLFSGVCPKNTNENKAKEVHTKDFVQIK